jgi:hypothetical protein
LFRRWKANEAVRALAYIIAGHELHHRRILQEKCFAASPESRCHALIAWLRGKGAYADPIACLVSES